MNAASEIELGHMIVRCPRCHAGRGERCRTPAGRLVGYAHSARERLFDITAGLGMIALLTVLVQRRASYEVMNRHFANACAEALGRSPIEPSSIMSLPQPGRMSS